MQLTDCTITKQGKTLKERFREKVGLNWQWLSGKSKNGYGMMSIDGKMVYAHRLSYEIHHGKIPEGMHVLHSCDDPGCVNPEHLHLGTRKDNMSEMSKRHRGVHGEKQWGSKLTEKDVIEIRNKYKKGYIHQFIADEYSVSRSTISLILQKKRWNHI